MNKALSLLTAVFLSTAPTAAQPEDPIFGEILDVRVINVEVVVTEDGQRVPGLTADDFRLLVDGEEVAIDFFSEIRDGAGVPSLDGAADVPSVAPGDAVATSYLLFIDDYFALPTHRDRVIDRIAGDLDLLGPEDRMAVVAFDGRKIEMLSNWTSSREQLRSALEAAKDRRAHGLQRRAEARMHDDFKRQQRYLAANLGPRGDVEEGGEPGVDGLANLPPEDLQRSWEVTTQVQRAVYGASSALRAFGRPPGRKVTLLLSGGWPAAPESWVVGTYDATIGTVHLSSGRSLYRPLVDTANLLGYTLYPVDLDHDLGSGLGAELARVEDAEAATRLAFDRDRISEGTLIHLAESTGGRAYLDGGSFDAFAETVADTRTYYWLGFSPSWSADDRQHRIDVEVDRPGVEVRTRGGFSDLSRQTEVTMLVESAQLLDLPLPGWESELSATLGEPQPAGFRKVAVPLALEIPLDRVTFLHDGEAYVAELELRVAATDDGGNTAEIPVIPVKVRGIRPPQPEERGTFETAIRLRKRPHELLLALYDPPTGKVLSTRVDFEPASHRPEES